LGVVSEAGEAAREDDVDITGESGYVVRDAKG